jgi:hypothetical protein
MAPSFVTLVLTLLALRAPTPIAGTTLVGRILDESRAPLVSREVWYDIRCDEALPEGSAAVSHAGGTARTDADGRLRIEIDASEIVRVARTLRLTLAEHDLAAPQRSADAPDSRSALQQLLDEPSPSPRVRPPFAECALPANFVGGEWNLGEQVLHAPGSPARFAALSDEQLFARYRALLAAVLRTNEARNESLEELLCELVRRATPACASFAAERLALARREPDWAGFEGDLPGLAWLVALRRIQQLPDPVAIAFDTEGTLESTFPCFPRVGFGLRNVDSEGLSLNLVQALLRYGLDGVGPTGEPLQPSRCAPRAFSGGGTPVTLDRGGSLSGSLAAATWLKLDRPGTYRLRVSLLPGQCDPNERDLRGRIALVSPELAVRLRPLKVRLSHAEHEQQLAWLRAIDATRTIPILTMPGPNEPADPALRPASDWAKPAEAPDDRLYRTGFRALPALFDALDDATLDLPHRAWAVALLWDLTGVHEAGSAGVGRKHVCPQWPTLRAEGPILASGSTYDSSPLDEARLERTLERWKRYRAFVEVEWTD